MGKKNFTEEQIAFALRQAESGTSVAQVIRKLGISVFWCGRYRWRIGWLSVGTVAFWGFPERLTVTGAGAIRGPSFAFDFETWRPVVCTMGIHGSGCSCVVKDGS
jgi:hypothetical protein